MTTQPDLRLRCTDCLVKYNLIDSGSPQVYIRLSWEELTRVKDNVCSLSNDEAQMRLKDLKRSIGKTIPAKSPEKLSGQKKMVFDDEVVNFAVLCARLVKKLELYISFTN